MALAVKNSAHAHLFIDISVFEPYCDFTKLTNNCSQTCNFKHGALKTSKSCEQAQQS